MTYVNGVGVVTISNPSLRLWLGLGLCVAVQPRQVRKEAAAYRFSRNPIPLSRVFDSKINHCGLYSFFTAKSIRV